MNILNKLSIKNLKLNKKRTISTIIGIVLSVALICAVATMATSFRETLLQGAISKRGYYHIKLSDITENDIKDIKNNRDIKDIKQIQEVGYAELKTSQNKDKPYIHLYSMENSTFEFLKFKLIEGNFPKNENEIIISKHIITNGKSDIKIGDTITLDVGKRISSDNIELDSSCSYNSEHEKIEDSEKHTFKVVGMIERPDYTFENTGDPGYTMITTNLNRGKTEAYLSLKKPKEYKSSISELLGVNYDDLDVIEKNGGETKYKHEINSEILRWEVFAFSDSTVSMLYSVIGVVIFIIIFTSVFCIRNSFAISITEKIKMYGMLSSVGATRKQIKKNVIFEAMALGLIGIPLGILSGLFADFVLLKIVNVLLSDALVGYANGIVFKVSIIPIIISIILGFITIYLSAISSEKKAAKVSPIEQLRNSDEIKIKNKKLKTPKIIEKVFKTGGILAYKNLKRSKKKYRTTVISIAVSVFIFITMNAFITNMFDLTGQYYEDYNYNFIVESSKFTDEEINKIVKQESVESYHILYQPKRMYEIRDLSKIHEYGKELITEELLGEKYCGLYLVALDEASFKEYSKKIGVKFEDVKDTGILCDEYNEYDKKTGAVELKRLYKYEKGDTIVGEYNKEELKIKVGDVSKIKPYGMERVFYDGGVLVVNKNEFKNIDFSDDVTITIQSNNTTELQTAIEEKDSSLSIVNLEDVAKEEKSMILVTNIFLYGFIAVITLIGVTNIFNTITSNMELRQKEFAMLKSIGMTKKEFNRMINLETLFYGTKSLLYGIILGLLGTLAMYKAFSVKIDAGMYIPIKPIIISVIFVFILIFIIMRYSISKINKQNTIETIRKENI
ncbi:MAG TPA: ABC transporter permease [Clostridiaceae bacterium]|nr:ABC transporter permease [Clostridiaceae bacterium]